MSRNVLSKAIGVIVVLFAAFGGFLSGIAPPEEADAKFAVGLSSFLALIILLAIAALAKKKHSREWIIAACVLFVIAVPSAFLYWSNSVDYTFEYPPGSGRADHVAGDQLTPEARAYKGIHTGLSNAQLLARFGGLENMQKVWLPESIRTARTKLIGCYLLMVLMIASALFALTEGALGGGGVRAQGKARSRRSNIS